MAFQPGQSGNPKGRPPGRPDRRSALRDAIASHVPEIIERLAEAAKSGDTRAAEVLLARAVAPLRAETAASPVEVVGPVDARSIAMDALAAAARGELPPDAAAMVIAAAESATRVRLLHELEDRVAALEGVTRGKR